jgi:hypothetical protein
MLLIFLKYSCTSSLLLPNILLSIVLLKHLQSMLFPNVRHRVSHPYKMAGKFIALYMLILWKGKDYF